MSRRLAALDLTKGTAIFLVVLGHIVAREDIAPGAEWYADFRNAIYLFHMPFFMALSGMALGLSWRHRSSMAEVGGMVVQRQRQFAVPFFVFALVILMGKWLASHWVKVDNPPGELLSSFLRIVLTPMQSPAGYLWYLQVLATYYLVTPWLLQASPRWTPWALVLAGILMQPFEWPALLSVHFSAGYLPFFAGGILIGQHWNWLQSHAMSKRSWVLWLLSFAAIVVTTAWARLSPSGWRVRFPSHSC